MVAVPILGSFSNELIPFLLIVLVALAILTVLFVWTRRGVASKRVVSVDRTSRVVEDFSATARPLLSKTEATLYNLVQLAVQDFYLVFAKIPLSSLVILAGEDTGDRRTILRAIRSTRMDVVLAHPGTLLPVKVITFLDKQNGVAPRTHQEKLVRGVLQSARIEEVQLEPHLTYSVARLTEILGLKEEE